MCQFSQDRFDPGCSRAFVIERADLAFQGTAGHALCRGMPAHLSAGLHVQCVDGTQYLLA